MGRNVLIVVAGIKRSGSTAQYNVIRIALEVAGYQVNKQGQDYELENGMVNLVKIHPYRSRLADIADYIFLTDRDDEGIRKSLTAFNGTEPPKGRVKKLRTYLDKWRKHDHLLLDFDLLKKNPRRFVEYIVEYLWFNVDIDEVYRRFMELKPPKKGQDKETLLFHNHINNV